MDTDTKTRGDIKRLIELKNSLMSCQDEVKSIIGKEEYRKLIWEVSGLLEKLGYKEDTHGANTTF